AGGEESRHPDLNWGPTDYESVALPLSYAGTHPRPGSPRNAARGDLSPRRHGRQADSIPTACVRWLQTDTPRRASSRNHWESGPVGAVANAVGRAYRRRNPLLIPRPEIPDPRNPEEDMAEEASFM